jgi:hypothetical protein
MAKHAATSMPTETELKAALAAGDGSRAAPAPMRAPRARPGSDARALVTAWTERTKLDANRFLELQARAHREQVRWAEERKAEAVARSKETGEELRSGAASWRETMERFRTRDPAVRSPFLPTYASAGKPFLVWPTKGLELGDTHLEEDSWAKFAAHATRDVTETLRFVYVWQNPVDRWTAVNVRSYLGLNGWCQCGAGGGAAGIFPGGHARLWLQVILGLREWWNQPPTSPMSQTAQWNDALDLNADGGGWFGSVGAIVPATVDKNVGVGFDGFVLPPNGVGVFEVTLQVVTDVDDGAVDLDFASGGFEVSCPGVALFILT